MNKWPPGGRNGNFYKYRCQVNIMVDVVRAGRPGSAMGVCVGISNCSVVEWKGELEKARVSWALQGREWQGLGGGWPVLVESQGANHLAGCCLRLTILTRLTQVFLLIKVLMNKVRLSLD
jgi:hypothetical protein